jgi:hypothetical protein
VGRFGVALTGYDVPFIGYDLSRIGDDLAVVGRSVPDVRRSLPGVGCGFAAIGNAVPLFGPFIAAIREAVALPSPIIAEVCDVVTFVCLPLPHVREAFTFGGRRIGSPGGFVPAAVFACERAMRRECMAFSSVMAVTLGVVRLERLGREGSRFLVQDGCTLERFRDALVRHAETTPEFQRGHTNRRLSRTARERHVRHRHPDTTADGRGSPMSGPDGASDA